MNVLEQELTKIHAIQLIAAQDQVVIVGPLQKIPHVLPDGVSRSLVPLRAFGSLLCRQHIDEAAGEVIELVARLYVAMKRHAVELGQVVDRTKTRVQAVADGNIDQA